MTENEEDIVMDRRNPFLQPVILDVFFKQLSVEELAKCRLMSKQWYNMSLSTWRSKATVKIEGVVSNQDDGSTSITSLGAFLDLWEEAEWGSCPFKRFHFHSWNFKAWELEHERFVKLVGGHITSLTLENCSFVGRDNFRRFVYQTFPKLQFLKINACEVDNNEYWYEAPEEIPVYDEPAFGVHELQSLDIVTCFPDSKLNMLSHFHKLTSLKMGTLDQEGYRKLLKTIRLIRAQDKTKLPLKNFDVLFQFQLGQFTASSIELLRLQEQLNLPIQCLHIWFDPAEDIYRNLDNTNVIRDIVQHHFSTLKQLTFGGSFGHGGLCHSFPFGVQLEKLEELVIATTRFSDHLNFLRSTPNLRILRIGDTRLSLSESGNLFSNSEQLEIGDWTLTALTNLTFPFPLSHCNLVKLMKWMPNVESLSLVLDDVKFSMVCKNWENLKGLQDYGAELTDEGVIGTEYLHEAGGDGGTCPNITKLKNLISFETSSSKLTSACVRDGFLKLANLKYLTLGESTEIDHEAKVALKRRKIELNFL